MHRKSDYLLLGLLAAIAGCSARAGEGFRAPDEPGELRVRLDKDAIQALRSPERQVHVSGMAKVSVAPDVADLSIGVTTAGSTALEAVAANNRAMTSLIEAIKQRGIPAKDIQTSTLTITPQYSRAAESRPDVPPEMTVPKVVGYDVANTLLVTSRDIAKVGELLDAALGAGSNQLNGVSFRIDDREALLEGLRAKAFDDARKKAELYARRAGMELGPVSQISEGDGGWMPEPRMPMGMGAPMMAPAPMMMAPSMPVNPGEREVSLSVSVSFELIPKK